MPYALCLLSYALCVHTHYLPPYSACLYARSHVCVCVVVVVGGGAVMYEPATPPISPAELKLGTTQPKPPTHVSASNSSNFSCSLLN